MGIIIGIDIGGSNTKIVGIKGDTILSPIQVRATDPIASLYGAFGKYLSENKIQLSDVERVMITGVGASGVEKPIYGIRTFKVDEFQSVGLGGLYLSKLKKAVIVSMGTGTAYVIADGNKVTHLGGTGVGGGTLLGLSKKMINVGKFDDIINMAATGDLSMVDLSIKDITKERVSTLTPDVTASNFGKISDLATKNDLALGIINLVFQTIGMLAVFATKITGDSNVVLTGFLTVVPQTEVIFNQLESMFDIKFIVPEHAEYATAIGAALSYNIENNYKEII